MTDLVELKAPTIPHTSQPATPITIATIKKSHESNNLHADWVGRVTIPCNNHSPERTSR